jgi:hypothetical protein
MGSGRYIQNLVVEAHCPLERSFSRKGPMSDQIELTRFA